MTTTITHTPRRLAPAATPAERLLLRGSLLIQSWVAARVERRLTRRSVRPDLTAATERRRLVHAAARLGGARL